ncbi:DUF1993 domain-containing protein [Oricola sp.]|uniref:DUF1993 domain-containing protein n=1 Tax=Oricola sp. TaxID=1979950 RepID=UPI0025F356A4|nr:DUF1993 domain-containing protein [Oricola sp.]MCI5075169.1 DUF1993 domain-containing protein [Oricola sp.]
MPLTLYDVSIPVFTRELQNMSGFLEKGRAFADETGLSHDELLNARLYPDMEPLVFQVRRACDAARLTAVRVGQAEPLDIADTEKSFDDLEARIVRTLGYLDAVPQSAMEGREDVQIVLPAPERDLTFTARDYVMAFALPNFFYRATMAYALLRHNGVPVRKADFISGG